MKNNLEQFRKELNISQVELAKNLAVSRQTISSIENGRYNPTVVLALKIAQFFQCNVEEIFILEGKE